MIQFDNVTIRFGERHVADDFNLTLNDAEFTCIIGPSGCGKTTLLNAIADLQVVTSGTINEPNARIGYIFQDHNIFPWKTTRQNIMFGLVSLKEDYDSKNTQVEVVAEKLGLTAYLDDYPRSLSGGLKQRVGIARALVCSPEVILMDEPFTALDALTATKTRELLKKICKEQQVTTIFVTHDIDEALMLADRIIVVSNSPMVVVMDEKLNQTTGASESVTLKLKKRIYESLEAE